MAFWWDGQEKNNHIFFRINGARKNWQDENPFGMTIGLSTETPQGSKSWKSLQNSFKPFSIGLFPPIDFRKIFLNSEGSLMANVLGN